LPGDPEREKKKTSSSKGYQLSRMALWAMVQKQSGTPEGDDYDFNRDPQFRNQGA
jgi:hypothetical protein